MADIVFFQIITTVCCASTGNMDDIRFIKLVFLFLTYIFLSNQMVPNDVTTSAADVTTMTSPTNDYNDFQCPLIETTNTSLKEMIYIIIRSASCKNGRGMNGCCLERFYCDYNTSHIDLTLYGPPGFRMPCAPKEICCPQKYILPIPLSNTTKNENDDSANVSDDSNE